MKTIYTLFVVLFMSTQYVNAQQNNVFEEKIHNFVQHKAYPKDIEILAFKEELKQFIKEKWNVSFAEVRLRFLVEKNGTISNLQIVSDEWKVNDEIINEVAETMNKKVWIPAQHNEQYVRSSYTLPINFQL